MFKLAVIGTTPTGGPFIRIHRDVIEPVNIKLDHIPEKGNTTVSNYRTRQYFNWTMDQKKGNITYLIIEPINIKLDHIPEKSNIAVFNYRTSQY